MTREIALIVGNGLSISFNKHHSITDFSDTQNPLSWPVFTPGQKNLLIQNLPHLNEFIQKNKGMSDFDIFKLAAKIPFINHPSVLFSSSGKMVTLECRHFLTLAFSYYSIATKKKMQATWPWYQWLSQHKYRLSAISSYNYDLILETALERLGVFFKDAAKPLKYGSVLLHKPHGSCNYESDEAFIKIDNLSYPLRGYVDNNQSHFRRLKPNALITPRTEPMCVIPNEPNIYDHYYLMKGQDTLFHEHLAKTKSCVFIGNSYMACDRPEINKVLESLNPDCKVIIANPNPCPIFLEKIESLNIKFDIWSNPKGPFDSNNNLITI